MANSLNTLSLSKEFERYYRFLLNRFDLLDATAILNDFFIIAIRNVKNRKTRSCALSKCSSSDFFFTDYSLIAKNINILEPIFLSVQSLASNTKNLDEFEKMLGQTLEKHINRKDTGSYYTPVDTTNFICWNAIFISVLNKMDTQVLNKIYSAMNISNNVEFIDKRLTFEEKIKVIKKTLNEKDIDKLVNATSRIRIVDPTCGSGAFIVSAYECKKYLNEKLFDNKMPSSQYYENIYGVDILPEAVIISKARLIIKAVIDDIFSDELVKSLSSNYVAADALCGSDGEIKGKGGLNWNNMGLFDCVVGNPPYVEIKDKTDFSHYITSRCGNLYAYTIERACNLSKKGTVISFVVPLPFIATSRMGPIREYLEEKSSIIYYCTFADRPGCLFTGVHQRLTIFFSSVGDDECRRFTSNYQFWYKDERAFLFKSLDFIENHNLMLPKVGTAVENSIFVKNNLCTTSLFNLSDDDEKYKLYISSRIGFWAKAFLEIPNTREITVLSFESDVDRRIAYCFINSSYFYFNWILVSDCWHVTNCDLANIKFNYSKLSNKQIQRLVLLSDELSNDLEKNKVRINSKQTEFEYKHKYSKKIIDKIDDIICNNCGLDENETKFIKNYTLKYRLNKAKESEEK